MHGLHVYHIQSFKPHLNCTIKHGAMVSRIGSTENARLENAGKDYVWNTVHC